MGIYDISINFVYMEDMVEFGGFNMDMYLLDVNLLLILMNRYLFISGKRG